MPPGRSVHVVFGNYADHKHPKVRAMLGRHSRIDFHFTPPSASWLNTVELFHIRASSQSRRWETP